MFVFTHSRPAAGPEQEVQGPAPAPLMLLLPQSRAAEVPNLGALLLLSIRHLANSGAVWEWGSEGSLVSGQTLTSATG